MLGSKFHNRPAQWEEDPLALSIPDSAVLHCSACLLVALAHYAVSASSASVLAHKQTKVRVCNSVPLALQKGTLAVRGRQLAATVARLLVEDVHFLEHAKIRGRRVPYVQASTACMYIQRPITRNGYRRLTWSSCARLLCCSAQRFQPRVIEKGATIMLYLERQVARSVRRTKHCCGVRSLGQGTCPSPKPTTDSRLLGREQGPSQPRRNPAVSLSPRRALQRRFPFDTLSQRLPSLHPGLVLRGQWHLA